MLWKSHFTFYLLHKNEEEYYCTIAKSQMTIYFSHIISDYTTKRVTVSIFWWEHLDHQHILGFSQKRTVISSFFLTHIVDVENWHLIVHAGIFLRYKKMCESNQVQFDTLCSTYWYSNPPCFNVVHFIENISNYLLLLFRDSISRYRKYQS